MGSSSAPPSDKAEAEFAGHGHNHEGHVASAEEGQTMTVPMPAEFSHLDEKKILRKVRWSSGGNTFESAFTKLEAQFQRLLNDLR